MKKTEERHNAWRQYKAEGHTNKEVAEHFGVHPDTVKEACRGIAPQGRWRNHIKQESAPKKTKEFFEKRNEEICNLRLSGAEFDDIASRYGLKIETVRSICQKSKIDIKRKEKRNQEIAALRRQGFSQTQIEEMFGLKCVSNICKRYGVAGIMSDRKPTVYRNGGTNQFKKATEAERKEYVERFIPDGFSYVGGYIDCEHDVTLRCDKCGNVFERSMNTLRNKNTRNVFCDVCEEAKRAKAKETQKKMKEEARKQKEVDRFARKLKRQADLETERFMKTILVECSECGKIFSTTDSHKVCCSSKCSRKRANNKHDRRLTKDKIVDNVTVDELFKRDKGRCWICGGLCDKSDFTMKEKAFVAGNNYPSIDHVVPVCMGGVDAWENVRLAHRICNTKRYFDEKLQPPIRAVTA